MASSSSTRAISHRFSSGLVCISLVRGGVQEGWGCRQGGRVVVRVSVSVSVRVRGRVRLRLRLRLEAEAEGRAARTRASRADCARQ